MSAASTGNGWGQERISEDRAERAWRVARLIGSEPFRKRSWAELGYFLASSALSVVAALVLGALGLAGLALSLVIVGVPVLAVGLRAARGLGRWQRALSWRLLGEATVEPAPISSRTGRLGWLRASLGDWAAWRSLAYFAAKLPLTIFGVWFALSVWLEALVGLASPLTGHSWPAGVGVFGRLFNSRDGTTVAPRVGTHLSVFLVGVFLLLLAPWTMRLVVYLDRRLMHVLLGPDATASRVRSLEEARWKTLDATTETLRRIERDLHDGTQAQLVALAMRLGQAKDQLDHLNGTDRSGDLALVRRLIDDAHQGAKEAITDLRDLARGIHPPALDTGLDHALATLAARSPLPTEVTVSMATRPSSAIEAIGYFCAAELLANVVQHAQATRASLSCAQHGPWLRIVVRDDGHGGAAIDRVASSSGLAGLLDRVEAVDGHLGIASPRGGPTVIIVDLPAPS